MKNIVLKNICLCISAAAIFSSCKPEERVIGTTETSWQLLAASETPAALKIIEHPGSKIIQDDAYFSANQQEFPAVTKIVEYKGALYLLKKDSAQIEVVDNKTFKKVGGIDLGANSGSALDITFANATTAYVIHANSSMVSVIDITTNTVARTIAVGRVPVAIAAVGNQVYVANQDDNTVSVIDTRTNIVEATLPVHTAPMALQGHPEQNEMLVLSLGGGKLLKEGEAKSPARLTFIDAATRQTISSVSVFEVAKDSLIGVPIGFALAQSAYPYAFVAFKKSLIRVDARRHNSAKVIQRTIPASGIVYNFKRNELFISNRDAASTQVTTADPVSGDKRSTFTLPFSANYLLPF
ncbi:MAG: YncE family protein [Bacteroidota bacterium]